MGIAQSISQILTEKLKLKQKNEHCKDDSPEQVNTDDSPEQVNTDDSPEQVNTDDSCNKEVDASLFFGTHEMQVSDKGEADLHKHFVGCKKNPGHKQFVPVNEFNINHLPEGHRDTDLVGVIKAVADLTVRLRVEMTSKERPEFWPNTNHPYPFYEKRGSDVVRLGTGMMWCVRKWTEEEIKGYNNGTCTCLTCQNTNTTNKVQGGIVMFTARHVVFDDLEARHTRCRLFYDREDSLLVTLDGWVVVDADSEKDWCQLKYVTCDLLLLEKLETMFNRWWHLLNKTCPKYQKSREHDKLTFIVSHPHGCSKQISVGHWIDEYRTDELLSKYTYTACTCPGTSGANVHPVGYVGWFFGQHVHSGVNTKGINFCAIEYHTYKRLNSLINLDPAVVSSIYCCNRHNPYHALYTVITRPHELLSTLLHRFI